MENEVLIIEENITEFMNQDLEAMKLYLESSEDAELDTTPEPIYQEKKVDYKTCNCGNNLFESPKGQFRCGFCGNILYKKNLEGD